MKLPWSKPDEKSGGAWIALASLPGAVWGQTDPATLVRDGYAGNAIVYRCARMIAEGAASIAFECGDDAVQKLLDEPSPDQSGQALLEQLYIDLQVTGNAWAEALKQDTLLEAARRHLREIAISTAQPGDVYLFRMGLGHPAKHCAIVSGEARIIHAYWGKAVCETRLVPWWARRIAAAFAFPERLLTERAQPCDRG